MTDAVCTIAVASDPAVDGLASTGAAIALWTILAAALMLVGIAVLVLRRRRPLRGAAALAVLGLVLGGTV
ncbi:MAG: LPXTG cell wall anchor domain-containing protein, partial [Protaetiibacter sp.]